MIETYKDYKQYVELDKVANKINCVSAHMRITWKYLIAMRRYEFILNSNLPLKKIVSAVARFFYHRLSVKSGIQIPPNTFGPGLYIPHFGAIVVNETARFGSDCVIQCGVNISEGAGGGTHIYLGAGCKIMKDVYLANDVIVGANAVVTKNVTNENVTVVGIPSTIVSWTGFKERNRPI